MTKPIVAETYRVRSNTNEGLLFLDFTASGGRTYKFVISPLAVDDFCAHLKAAAAQTPATLAVVPTSAGFQSRKRCLMAGEVREHLSDLSRDRSFVVGIEASRQRLWALFHLPEKQVFELMLPLADARKLFEGIGKSLAALSADPPTSTQ